MKVLKWFMLSVREAGGFVVLGKWFAQQLMLMALVFGLSILFIIVAPKIFM